MESKISSFERLTKKYESSKDQLDNSLLKLLGEKPNFTAKTLNEAQINGSKFFSDFEVFLAACRRDGENITPTQLEDILNSIENVLECAITYWNMLRLVSQQTGITIPTPQNNFLASCQIALKSHRKQVSQEFLRRFKDNNLPHGGLMSTRNIKLTEGSMHTPSFVTGIILLLISAVLIFIVGIHSSLPYLFLRITLSLGAGLLIAGVCKNYIKVNFKFKGATITAIGGVAVFLILYFLNPAPPPEFKTEAPTSSLIRQFNSPNQEKSKNQ